jgi:hypothetical protein
LGEKPLLVERPELADIAVCLDGVLCQLAVLLHQLTDIGVADNVAEMVEVERPTRRVGQRYGTQRGDQSFLVVGLAAGRRQMYMPAA